MQGTIQTDISDHSYTSLVMTKVLAATERIALETSTKMHPTSVVSSIEEDSLEQTTAEGRPEAQLPHLSPRATDHMEEVGSQQGAGAIEDGGSARVMEDLWPQLMPKGETDLMYDMASRTESDSMKWKATEEEEEAGGKKRKHAIPEDRAGGEKGGPIVQGQAVTKTGPAEKQMSEGAPTGRRSENRSMISWGQLWRKVWWP